MRKEVTVKTKSSFSLVGNLASVERPYYWSQVVGQKHIKDVLRGMLGRGEIRHGFLMSGAAGTGKTSLLRILANVVNCENPDMETFEPCGECRVCKAMMQPAPNWGDYMEIDCGANGLVDHARSIQTIAANRPMRNFRMIVLDEAHNLTPQAQDALLKLFEKPSPHLIIGLATTDEHKLKPAILSRMEKFRTLPPTRTQVIKLVSAIAKDHKFKGGAEVIEAVVDACNNVPRDSVTALGMLLDASSTESGLKALTSSRAVTYVSDLLGSTPWVISSKAVGAVVNGDSATLVDCVRASGNNKTFMLRTLLYNLSTLAGDVAAGIDGQSQPALVKRITETKSLKLLLEVCDELGKRFVPISRFDVDAEHACLPYLLMATQKFKVL